MTFTEQTLEKLSAEIVSRFLTEKVALTDGVVDAAQTHELNPEQVKRLVEAVNTGAFLHKFNDPKDGASANGDRMVEFETADPNAALNRLLDNAKNEMSGDAATTEDPAGKLDMLRELPATREDMVATEATSPASEQDLGRPLDADASILRSNDIHKLRKTAALLKEQTYQHRVEFTEAVQKLVTQLTKLGEVPFEAFEKDAFYHYGERSAPHLQMLRAVLSKPAVEYDHTAFTKVARVVDTRTPEMRSLLSMMMSSERSRSSERAFNKIAELLGKDL
jgi:hypothetical protein